jgi:gas vesicle protein
MADDKGCSLGAVGLIFLSGAAIGAGVALLLAPQSGRETREQLRGYARRAEENVHELADRATEALGKTLDNGREFIKDKQAVLTEAVEAGRAAMQWERNRLPGEKKP